MNYCECMCVAGLGAHFQCFPMNTLKPVYPAVLSTPHWSGLLLVPLTINLAAFIILPEEVLTAINISPDWPSSRLRGLGWTWGLWMGLHTWCCLLASWFHLLVANTPTSHKWCSTCWQVPRGTLRLPWCLIAMMKPRRNCMLANSTAGPLFSLQIPELYMDLLSS